MRKHIAVAALVAAALTALSDVSYLGSATSGDAGQTRPTGLTAERLGNFLSRLFLRLFLLSVRL